ncbi:inner membrane-spanning protein YciB [Sphingorhabdus lacus]|uniref:Inner membrane-spanning protein YciB n=1 Tax=Sphingorhabdus lacus TaxID=392610 RepID=A0A6I6L7X9_9SPHN|nr:inner membrane-spanning protein YciB [Sphingorhabdus lacus]QGY80076.1 septation protein IspZ [Sphingorhabdus lacus]
MTSEPTAKKPSGLLNFALDFGPLLIFFLGSRFGHSDTDPVQGPLAGTAAFMVAIVIAMIVSKWKIGRISPMMKMSAVFVIGFGALTLWFRDFGFIQHKATAVYLLFAAIILIGWLRSKPALKYLLEQAYDGLSEQGWLKLSLSWGIFFLVLAGLNEAMIPLLTSDQYITVKTFGLPALTFLFAMANIPMLLRHGLNLGDETKDGGTPGL